MPDPDPEAVSTAGEAQQPNELAVLRALVHAHSQPDPRTSSREPIMYLPFRGGVIHHALREEELAIDDALVEELHGHGFISIDYHANSWQLTPTPYGRNVIEEEDRTRAGGAADAASIVAAVESQSASANPLAWPAVRPVLEALRGYWQESGYPTHGIALVPIANEIPDEAAPIFAATIRSLTSGGYLARGELGGIIVTDDGRQIAFPGEVALTEKAHAILDGWPGAAPSELVENLLAILTSAAAEESDPVRKTRLESLASAIKDVGLAVTSDVIAKVITGGI